ncbi:putative 2-dehydropantoate 2-reductase [Smittium culicis]|uniref:2-dehydropantoate 2-reductase n=1 Tax=Smittium culicis TaxID=133412 RepID=A0A1R1YU75_9FUNG|nr:putative 2-dehydropantoate 2-reductase [Smittium culicis]
MTESKSFLVVGGGAVGSIFAWRLQEGGSNVALICRSNYQTILDTGFKIKSHQFGTATFNPNKVYTSAAQASAQGQKYDYILICTKSLPNRHNPADVLDGLDVSDSTIVLIQNGIGIEDPFYQKFSSAAIISSITYIDTKQVESGIIEHGISADLSFGLYDPEKRLSSNQSADKILNSLHHCLVQGKLKANINHNIQTERWYKLCWNASFNPISVVAGASNTVQLLSDPKMHALIATTMREIISVGEAYVGMPLSDKLPSDQIPEFYISFTKMRPDPVYPSMMVDFLNKRPMEHQVILKNPIDIAKSLNIKVPTLEFIYTFVSYLENKQLQ